MDSKKIEEFTNELNRKNELIAAYEELYNTANYVVNTELSLIGKAALYTNSIKMALLLPITKINQIKLKDGK